MSQMKKKRDGNELSMAEKQATSFFRCIHEKYEQPKKPREWPSVNQEMSVLPDKGCTLCKETIRSPDKFKTKEEEKSGYYLGEIK